MGTVQIMHLTVTKGTVEELHSISPWTCTLPLWQSILGNGYVGSAAVPQGLKIICHHLPFPVRQPSLVVQACGSWTHVKL